MNSAFGWILWDDETDAPFQRLAPEQWTGKTPKKPITVYRSQKQARNMADRWGCEIRSVYLGPRSSDGPSPP